MDITKDWTQIGLTLVISIASALLVVEKDNITSLVKSSKSIEDNRLSPGWFVTDDLAVGGMVGRSDGKIGEKTREALDTVSLSKLNFSSGEKFKSDFSDSLSQSESIY